MKSKLNLITEEIKEKAIKNEIEDENFLYSIRRLLFMNRPYERESKKRKRVSNGVMGYRTIDSL